MEPKTELFEVVVIGAGIIGSATAYYLAKKLGNKVLLLEQFDFLHRRGSSHGESRICRHTYPEDHYTFLMTHAYPAWNAAEVEAGTKVFSETGGLEFCHKNNPDLQSIIDAAQKWNIPHQILTPEQVNAKFPNITLPEDFMAVYSPSSGVLNATKAVSMFQNLARQNGCRLMDNSKIVGITLHQNASGEESFFEIEIIDQGGEVGGKKIYTKKCLITAGSWTQKVVNCVKVESEVLKQGSKLEKQLNQLNLNLPLTPIQSTVAYFRVNGNNVSGEFCGKNKKFPVFINYDLGLYGGPAVEFPNLIKIGLQGSTTRCDPDDRDFQPEFERIEAEISGHFLQKFFRHVQTKPVTAETCMLTRTPDFDFILDKVPGVDGLFLGCGFSGHGFKLAPIVGQILTGLVSTGESPFPSVQSHFRLNRF